MRENEPSATGGPADHAPRASEPPATDPGAPEARAPEASSADPRPVSAGFVPPAAPVTPAPPPALGPSDPPPPGPPSIEEPASGPGVTPPRRRRWTGLLAGIAIGAVVGGASGAGAALLIQQSGGNGTGLPVSGPQTIVVNDFDETTLVSAVAASAMPSVVTIAVAGSGGAGSGSGVVIDDEGHIVTNSHVVTLGGIAAEPSIRVTTSSGRIFDAEVVGIDPLMDLAVIKVDGADELTPIDFADSGDLNVGDITIAIGAPLGLAGTVTSGIISSLDRSIEVASSAVPADPGATEPGAPESGSPFDFFRFDVPEPAPGRSAGSGLVQLAVIQTDTAINSGSSGGALLDADGRLIGINVAIATGSAMNRGNIGVGFAIPSNVVSRIAAELIEDGEASHGLLGVTVANVLDDPAQADATVMGASVVSVVAGGAAEAAGLRVGDIIIALDDVSISSKTDLTAHVRTHGAGQTVEVLYVRGDQIRTAEVTLGSLAALGD